MRQPAPSAVTTGAAAETRSAPTTAVRLEKVTRLFGQHPALIEIDLTVFSGEVVLLHGHNGAGKTTLLRIVSTLIAPTWGRGEVLGLDVNSQRRSIRAGTEFLSHRTRLYDDLTPTEYLRFIARLDGRRDRLAVEEALDHVGLSSVSGERVRSFSQGMRQRLAIARAHLRRPRLLLLDEPYSALDAGAREAANTLVIDVKKTGGTAIIATHDTVRAAAVADRPVELLGGRIANNGALG